ncbi:glycine--tRNA ligase subunit beta [Coriobacteriia bacterium Es71-Z0120]|uniref:glycine--tRNA ligase subunit beta n=1 Tax=Parvivirga hydrogeniphila TaxID=2939460 RepID=UPI002260EBBE|nr:glycine--tRNA ligase subunit beta [Parvivirga hydrogeniphila]MCL4079002.1 glycine--tRNA ligase subunit beta [Parvivirga hydrogeniphila]
MPRDLLFEIGVEEMPSAPLYSALEQVSTASADALAAARLEHGEISVYGSPRRIALLVRDVAERQRDVTERVKGPAAAAAYDADGNPTPAALGFARSRGVDPGSLVRESTDGGEYVWAVIERPGLPAEEVLPGLLSDLAGSIQWPKTMRWGSGDARFIRPVRWLVALFGDEVLPVTFAGLTAGCTSYGHRFLAGPVTIETPSSYLEALRAASVIADGAERAAAIREGIASVADSLGGVAVVPEDTFLEVVNLVENPTVAAGRFDEAFLRVPREVLEEAMESHQRYFPVEDLNGSLMPAFLVVHNGPADRTPQIVAGHERVIRARLADAAFFYDEDLKHSLESYVGKLDGIVFHQRLGSLGQKVARVERLTRLLAKEVGAGPEDEAHAVRAAHLCKADLVTHVVVEFTSLQGVMGSYYALASGEAPAVAQAIVDHYRPRYAGDALPESLPGMLVSAADKLDTICGIHAAKQAPTGSSDPFALRRFAIGIIAMVIDGGLHLRLGRAIADAVDGYAEVLSDMDAASVVAEVKEFFLGRVQGVLRERGYAYDTIDAVLASESDDLAEVAARCAALQDARDADPELFEDLAIAFRRAANLADPSLGEGVSRDLMGDEERALADALEAADRTVQELLARGRHDDVLSELAALRPHIDAFFESVLVMDEDLRLRENRLRLLNRFVRVFSRFADFGRIAA